MQTKIEQLTQTEIEFNELMDELKTHRKAIYGLSKQIGDVQYLIKQGNYLENRLDELEAKLFNITTEEIQDE